MNAVITIWQSNMKKFFRNKMESVGSLIQPILWLLIFSVGMSRFISDTNASFNYMTFVLPGIIGFTLVSASINGGTSWIDDRMNGVVKTYQVAPISRCVPLIANILTIVAKSILQGIIIIIMGLILGASIKISLIGLILSILLIVLFVFGFAGVALYFASSAANSGAYHMVIFLFQMPLLFFSNALYGLEQMPVALKAIAYLNPMSYLASGLRALFASSTQIDYVALLVQIGVLALFAAFGLLISKKAYSKLVWKK